MMKKIIAVLTSVMLIGGILTGCGSSQSTAGGSKEAASGDTIKIGAMFNLTGDQASIDVPAFQGFKLKAKQINEAGGINGKQIEIVSYDGKTDQTTCANNAKKMIDVDGCLLLGGLSDTNYALAAGAVAQEKGVPIVISGATQPDLCDQVGDFCFQTSFGDDTCGHATAVYSYENFGPKAYLLVDQAMEYTVSLSEYFKEKFESLGGVVVAQDSFSTGDPDYSAQIDKYLNGEEADFLYIASGPDDAGPIVQQFRAKGIETPIISGDGFDTTTIRDVAGDLATEVYCGTHCSFNDDSELVQNFVKTYTEEYGTAPENAFAALGYDAMAILAKGMEDAGTEDREAIKNAIAAITDYDIVTGKVSYSADKHLPEKTVSMCKLVDGVYEFIKIQSAE